MSAPRDRRRARSLVCLRAGDGRPAVYLFPGGGGEARELAPLAARMAPGRPVVGVEVYGIGGSVEDMAARALAAICADQPQGPYHLVGYSFGGLVALETARRLRAQGQAVGLLALIDVVCHSRYWPTRLFLQAQARRAAIQLGHLAALRPAEAGRMLAHRARRLVGKFAERLAPAPQASVPLSPPPTLRAAADAAMAAYRPRPYDGPVLLLRSARSDDFGCDPAALWGPLIAGLDVHPVYSSHLGVVREALALDQVAAILDSRLAEPPAPRDPSAPRVLLTTAIGWQATSRLALELHEAGFSIQALCPDGHSLRRMNFVDGFHPYRPLAPQAGLRAAIAAAKPELVLPCDDRAAQQLQRLRAECGDDPAGAALKALIVRSMGDLQDPALLLSRRGIMDLAAELEIRRPPTAAPADAAAAAAWMRARDAPAVLKADGSWGGCGVAVVRDEHEAVRAFRRLTGRPGLLRTIKRLLLDRDPSLLLAQLPGRRPAVIIQDFVAGRPANAAAACLAGEVLGAVYVEVVRSDGPTGPSTVVQVIDHPEMAQAVTRMARRLRLSGLYGFDFVLEQGAAHLIELNPRATPTCHLAPAKGADPLAALYTALTGAQPPAARAARTGGLVAMFPQEITRDTQSPFLHTAHHDAPWRAPILVELGFAQAARRRSRSRLRRWRGALARWTAGGGLDLRPRRKETSKVPNPPPLG